MPVRALFTVAIGAGAWLYEAAESVSTGGANLTGIAAIIAASAGMVSAIGAILIGLRSSRAESDAKEELLMELLEDRLERQRKKRGA